MQRGKVFVPTVKRAFSTTRVALADSKKVNVVYKPYNKPLPSLDATKQSSVDAASFTPDYKAIAEKQSSKDWNVANVRNVIDNNTLFTWNASGAVQYLVANKGEGVYFYDMDGKKYLDFNSQAMCSNMGHSVPPSVVQAVKEQMESIPYVYPCSAVTPIKAKLASFMADLMPGDLKHFFFTCGGAESNETALRMARLYTGRHKVISRYRSYHGGTLATMGLTGDPRRWGAEPSISGVIHIMDPYPYSFSWATDGKAAEEQEKEITEKSLLLLRETIEYEGPKSIAAIFLESVVGTNGVLKQPKGYLEGVRALCDEYGILLVCDEVMAGFGRTGKLFGFMHTDPLVIPDIVTMAKGINAAYVPLGAVAVRDHVAAHFKKNPIGIGTTYNSHPVGLASAYAVLQHFFESDVLGNVAKMEKIAQEEMDRLAKKHRSVKQARCVGLFGMIDLQKNAQGDPFVFYNGPAHPALLKLKQFFTDNGLFTLIRWSSFMCNPPLIINEAELREAFAIIDRGLEITDAAFESQ